MVKDERGMGCTTCGCSGDGVTVGLSAGWLVGGTAVARVPFSALIGVGDVVETAVSVADRMASRRHPANNRAKIKMI